jgi:hypothetical protein
MLSLSFGLLLVTGLIGSVLGVAHLRGGAGARPGWRVGVLHASLGAAGLGTLLLSLSGPPRGAEMGVAAFGRISATLIAITLIVGLSILFLRLRRRRLPGLIIAMHATLAISGITVLAAYVLMG